jgi:hypothetical protein
MHRLKVHAQVDHRYADHVGVWPPACCAVLWPVQGGAVKQYKGLECPLDGFELVLFSLSGVVSGQSDITPWP